MGAGAMTRSTRDTESSSGDAGRGPRIARSRQPVYALLLGSVIALFLLTLMERTLGQLRPDPGVAAIRRAESLGQPFDRRSRSQVVADLRAEGIEAVPRLVPAGLLEDGPEGGVRSRITSAGGELLPLAGIANRTTVLCNETGQWAVYEADEHGFRNPPGAWRRIPADLLLVGDSFTIGECVAPGETVADNLRLTWPATLNLGYSGNSPLLELATLVEYAPALRPRITLWLFFENDLSWFDLGRSAKSPLLMSYLRAGFSQDLLRRQPEIDGRLASLLDSRIAQPDEQGPVAELEARRGSVGRRLLDFIRLKRTRLFLSRLRGRPAGSSRPLDHGLFREILARAREIVAAWQGEIVVVFLPGAWQFDPNAPAPRWTRSDLARAIRDDARSVGLDFVDVAAALARQPDPLSHYSYRGESLLGSPHMNAAGYALAASVIRDAIRQGSGTAEAGLSFPSSSASSPSARRSQISRQ